MPPVRRAPFKQVDRHFNAQYVARPADSQKKRLSTREPYAKPAVAAATSVSPYKRDAAREAGQKALQSLAAAQKRVQKTLRPNMAARRVNVPDPAGLRSPSAMFPSGDLPITDKQMQDVVENAKGRCPKEQLDRMVGDHIASLLPPLGVTTTVCLASMQAVHELGKAPCNNVVRQPSKSTYYPTRLKVIILCMLTRPHIEKLIVLLHSAAAGRSQLRSTPSSSWTNCRGYTSIISHLAGMATHT